MKTLLATTLLITVVVHPALLRGEPAVSNENPGVQSAVADPDCSRFDDVLKIHPDMAWPKHYDGDGSKDETSSRHGIRNMPYEMLVNAGDDIVSKGLSRNQIAQVVENGFKIAPEGLG